MATQPVIAVIGKRRTYADTAALQSHVTTLSRTLHPRSAAHPEKLRRVAAYIETQFNKASTRVSLQTFAQVDCSADGPSGGASSAGASTDF